MDEEALLLFETGTECHYHPLELVSRSWENCSNNIADGAIYGRKLDFCEILRKIALIVETFLSMKRSIQSKLCVKLVSVSSERDCRWHRYRSRARMKLNESHANKN